MKAATGSTMIRQWRLLRLVAGSRYATTESIAQELNTSLKTIHRDILVLEAAGFPLYYEKHHGGASYIRLADDWFMRKAGQPKTVRQLEARPVAD